MVGSPRPMLSPEGLREQYATDVNLQARIALHERFSVRQDWSEWLWQREAPRPRARVLDLGCGPATLWRSMADRIDPTWSLTLVDFSPGMIDAAQRELGDRADYAVADAEELPFPDGSFDAVIANHMLYHVRNRSRAFAEIRRVLVSGGTLHASTIGRGYLAELVALAPFLNAGRYAETFGLETGPGQLRLFFNDVSAERFDDGLAVTHPEPLLAYIRSSEAYNGEDLTDARATVEEGIARDGSFFVSKPLGVVSGRRA